MLCKDNDCDTCFKKSFASHKRAVHWIADKNDVMPRDVFLGNKKKYWFKCHKCGYT
jgi:hypothetical protein